MCRLWSALSRLVPFQQFGNVIRSWRMWFRAQPGIVAEKGPRPGSPQVQPKSVVGSGRIAIAFPAIIFRPAGKGLTADVVRLM